MNGKLTATLSARGRLKATLSKATERVEPIIKPLEVTENGEYTAPENVHGFNPVKVDVPLKYDEGYTDGYQASQDSIKLQEKTATENGEVVTDEGFTGMSKVIVAVPIKEEQEKTVEITANGTVEVVPDEGKTLSKVTANVNVASTGVVGKPYIDSSKITDFSYFCFANARLNILEQIDTSNGITFSNMFKNSTSLITVPCLDVGKGTDFSNMFNGCSSLTTIQPLNTSNATNFYYMFSGCYKLKEAPITDSNNLTNCSFMFNNCKSLVSVTQLNTSKCTIFSYMFSGCSSLTTIPPLDTSKGTNFANTFYNCTSLETVSLTIAGKDLSSNTFQNCTALKNLTIGEGWAVNIYLHYSNELTVESLHGMIENLADLTGQTAKTFQVGATNIAKIDEAHIQMLNDKNWTYS